jgi:hypothetical protein
MSNRIEVSGVEKDDGDGLIVTFSDGTIGAYVAEELLELRPLRELATPKVESIRQEPLKHK